MSFSWLFATIVGAVVIFLAIFAAARFSETLIFQQNTFTAKKIVNSLSSFETTFETGRFGIMETRVETIIINNCTTSKEYGPFGALQIKSSQKIKFGSKNWSERDSAMISSKDKFLFSTGEVWGKKFYVFSKPLFFPFKIADLVYLWSDQQQFCFFNTPADIERELKNQKVENINFKRGPSPSGVCLPQETTVCFSSGQNCNITVDLSAKKVLKNGRTIHFEYAFGDYDQKALLYAAIFSDPEVYECQIKRLILRASYLSEVYYLKSEFLSPRGCGSDIVRNDLREYNATASSLTSSAGLHSLFSKAESIDDKNERLACKLY